MGVLDHLGLPMPEDEDAPEGWPQAPFSFWYRRHDEFDEPPPSARAGDVA